MSETKTEKKNVERVPYKVELSEHIEFSEDFSGKIITSNELCKLVNEYFKIAYADYYGCTFELSQGAPSINLFFNHARTTEDGVYACERAAGKTSGHDVVDKMRSRDRQMKEGDRYSITEDGKDIITGLLSPRYFNNGKPNWSSIVVDIVDRSAASYYQPQNVQHLTKVIGIDPRNICALLYGSKEDDSYLDYGVEVKRDLAMPGMPGNTTSNYVLYITKAYNDHLTKTFEKLGIGAMGSSIIR